MTLEVVREKGATSVSCNACIVGCESVGATTVAALTGLPCALYAIDQTADEEIARNGRN